MRIFHKLRWAVVAFLNRSPLGNSEGTEIIEFAVCLPLLVVLVVSMYDFGSAFTLKHKLLTSVREGARFASSQHPADLTGRPTCGAPQSVCLIRDIVDSELTASNINDCGLGSASATGGRLTWTFTGSCSEQPTLEVDRGIVNSPATAFPSPFDTSTYRIEETHITLTFPYQWQFNRAFQLLSPNANYLSSTITVTATMQNLD